MDTPEPTKSDQDVSMLLLAALDERWKKYSTELERCRSGFSEEAVHDLRVATRRILALIRLLHSVFPRPRLRKLSRAFKKQLDAFDELRDTQVILAELDKQEQELPQLHKFKTHLRALEEKLLRSLHKKVNKFKTSKIARRIRKTNNSLQTDLEEEISAQIMQAVDDAFLRTQKRLSRVDLAHPATIHRVRVAFKSFRYMVEIVHPLLPNFPEKNFKQMNHYQSLMGEVQDAEVFIETFDSFAEDASLSDLEPVRRYSEKRHAQAVAAYAEEMKNLQKFWRPAPDQPFPWETQNGE